MNKLTVSGALIAVALLAGCGDQPDSSAAQAAPDAPEISAAERASAVAIVFGEAVPVRLLDAFMQTRHGAANSAEVDDTRRREAVIELTDLLILGRNQTVTLPEEATQELSGVDLELATVYAAAQQGVVTWQTSNPISDQDARERYDAAMQAATVTRDYKLRHLTVTDEQAAGVLFDQLAAGERFDALELSVKAENGAAAAGELGWIPTDALLEDMLTAIEQADGSYTTPVKSDYGAHLFRIEGVREVAPPEFAAVAERIKQQIAGERFQTFLGAQREAAQIEFL